MGGRFHIVSGISLSLCVMALGGLQVTARAEDAPGVLDDGLPSPPVRPRPGVRLGATITPREIGTLDPATVLADAKALGISTIRLGVYWSEVQPDENTPPDFSKTLEWVRACEKAGLEVVLTVGIKAPRWPEFYIPKWAEPPAGLDEISKDKKLRERALLFVERTVNAFKGEKAITHWQVENEPMNRSGPVVYLKKFLWSGGKARWIGADFLAEEVAKVRSLDSRPIVLNFWSADEKHSSAPWGDSDYAKRNSLALGDIIGLDVYPSTGGKPDFGRKEVTKIPRDWLAKARAAGKDAWIVESQAEPWGDYKPTPEHVGQLLDQEIAMGYRTIFIWGFEWMARLYHSEDPKEREQGLALYQAVAKRAGREIMMRPGSSQPSPTPGMVAKLSNGR